MKRLVLPALVVLIIANFVGWNWYRYFSEKSSEIMETWFSVTGADQFLVIALVGTVVLLLAGVKVREIVD